MALLDYACLKEVFDLSVSCSSIVQLDRNGSSTIYGLDIGVFSRLDFDRVASDSISSLKSFLEDI